jgi:hypothetical protein
MRKLLFLFFFIVLSFCAKATHEYGAELTWANVGQDSFLVKFVLYIDCNGIQGWPGYLKTFCNVNDSLLSKIHYHSIVLKI